MRSIRLPSWTERLLGLEPQPVPPHVFALDAQYLRYGGFVREPAGLSFDRFAATELPPGLFPEGPLGGPARDVAALEQVVNEFVVSIGMDIREASLVLPDTWLRLLFTEVEELPAKPAQRDEIVRWKLKRLVPFRVEDLRVASAAVTPLSGQEAPQRLLLGFAIERLVGRLEEAFSRAGVALGQITNTTLAALSGLAVRLDPEVLTAMVLIDRDAYTVSFVLRNEPLLYRYKALAEVPEAARSTVVRRDLRLTGSFLTDHFPDAELGRLVIAVDEREERTPWIPWLEEELGVVAEPMGAAHLPLTTVREDLSWQEIALMVGCASAEVL